MVDIPRLAVPLSQPAMQADSSSGGPRFASSPRGRPIGTGGPCAAPSLGITDHGPQLFGELTVAEPRLVGGDLHGDGEEPVVVAIQMRLQQRLVCSALAMRDSRMRVLSGWSVHP